MKSIGFALAMILAGCTVNVTAPYPSQPQVVYQDRIVYQDRPAPEVEKKEDPVEFNTFEDAIDLCRAVQENQDVSMGCDVDILGDEKDVPTLTIVVPNDGYWEQKKESIVNLIAAPFCVGVADSWPKSILIYGVVSRKQMKLYSCSLGKWGDWMDWDHEDKSDYMM